MAVGVQVTGAALVKVDTGVSNALEDLGYSMNGIEISDEPYLSNVPSDENGGDEGPPIDVQIFGFHSTIRMELSRWDSAIAAKLDAFTYGGTSGTQTTSGTLMSGVSFRLVIVSTNLPRNYPVAWPSQPIEINKGTKFSRLAITWTAYGLTASEVWNTTTA